MNSKSDDAHVTAADTAESRAAVEAEKAAEAKKAEEARKADEAHKAEIAAGLAALKYQPKAVAKLDPAKQAFSEELLEHGSTPRRIAIIYSRGRLCDVEKSGDDFVTIEAEALRMLGHEVVIRGVDFNDYQQVIDDLDVDFVFNYTEGNGVDSEPSTEVVLALEKALIPFSGAGSGPLTLTNDKIWMKAALEAARVPTPAGAVMGHPDLEVPTDLKYPLFVKPRFGWGSVGVDANSLVHTPEELRAAVERVVTVTGMDAMIEEYIDGPELTVALIGGGPRVLPLPALEVEFGKAYSGGPQVRMYDTKQNQESPLYWDFRTRCPAHLSPEIAERVEQVAVRAYRAVNCDGYGRVDMRLDAEGTPYVLEVNANCSLELGAKEQDCGMFILVAQAMGWNFPDTIARLVGSGLLRGVRRYRAPRLLIGNKEGMKPYCPFSIRRGALVLPVGPLKTCGKSVPAGEVIECGKVRLYPDPHLRYIEHGDEPNLQVQLSRGKLWLAASRTIRAGEVFTVDRKSLLDGFESAAELGGLLPARRVNASALRKVVANDEEGSSDNTDRETTRSRRSKRV